MTDATKIKLMFIIGLSTVVVWTFKSYIEMQTFNRFSEQNATLIEAMFSNLRIISK